jgi:hypothetical protein
MKPPRPGPKRGAPDGGKRSGTSKNNKENKLVDPRIDAIVSQRLFPVNADEFLRLGERWLNAELVPFECAWCKVIHLDPVGTDERGSPLCNDCAIPAPSLEDEHPALKLVGLRKPLQREMNELWRLRGITIGAQRMAQDEGLLFALDSPEDGQLYVLTDQRRFSANLRRWDGALVPSISAKSKTYAGSWARWPIGIDRARSHAVILLCEGVPDGLSAFEFLRQRRQRAGVVVMLGGSLSIADEALELFKGISVRIVAHRDEAGDRALVNWWAQLDRVAANVDALVLDTLEGGKDLNDCLIRDVRIDLLAGVERRLEDRCTL